MGKVELRIELDADLVAKAEASGIDLVGVAQAAAKAAVADTSERRAARWAEENAEAIKAHRERIERYGVFGEDFRTW